MRLFGWTRIEEPAHYNWRSRPEVERRLKPVRHIVGWEWSE